MRRHASRRTVRTDRGKQGRRTYSERGNSPAASVATSSCCSGVPSGDGGVLRGRHCGRKGIQHEQDVQQNQQPGRACKQRLRCEARERCRRSLRRAQPGCQVSGRRWGRRSLSSQSLSTSKRSCEHRYQNLLYYLPALYVPV